MNRIGLIVVGIVLVLMTAMSTLFVVALLKEAEMRISKISLGANGEPNGAAPLDPEK